MDDIFRNKQGARRNFISWEVVARCRTGAATPAPGRDAILVWPRDKHDYNPTTTTSQEGGAVPEARPSGRVSGAVLFQFSN